jgi:glutathione S-transferase
MKLYYLPGACSLAPHIVINELGMKCAYVAVNPRTKHYEGDRDFREVNPKGSVPALEFGAGEVLTEVGVILQYLADQAPEANLVPKAGTMERYRCQEWLNYVATELHKGFSPLFNKSLPEEMREATISKLGDRFDFIEAWLKNNTYLMGAHYSVADAYAFTILNWSGYQKIDLSKWPNLMAYMERVMMREAVQTSFQEEGLNK